MFKKLIVMGLLFTVTGCAGLGFYKQCTLMPDEVSVSGSTNPNGEDSGKISFGFKWKLK